jgi:hypothetical protein
MKLLASLGVLALAGSAASAWVIPLFPSPSLFATTAPAAAQTADAPRGTDPGADIPVCVTNFSKDDCGGVIDPGTYAFTGCDITGCRTIVVREAVYQTALRSSNLACGIACESKCDEFPDGRFTLKFSYVLRADSCCPYRGSWHGDWEYVLPSGRIYTGEAHGTIGVCTNRISACPTSHDNCESCYDVQVTDSTLLIGFEGSFRGQALLSTSPYPNELNFTMDGTWIASALVAEPFRQQIRVRNRFDGSHLRWSCP